jgi:hypothetical protein
MPNAEERVTIVTAQLWRLSYKQGQEFMQEFRKPRLRANIQTLANKF